MTPRHAVFAMAAALLTFASALAQPTLPARQATRTVVVRNGTQPSQVGPAANFTGRMRIDNGFQRPAPARVGVSTVTFEPGARTAWHVHPLGQSLLVTAGVGWTQVEGDPVTEIRPGDVVWCPPGLKHWHGATPTNAMTHVAIYEALNGSPVTWMEHVTDAQYRVGPSR